MTVSATVRPTALAILQLAGIVILVHLAGIEGRAFRDVLLLAAAGSIVHLFLADRHRLFFFAVLSLVSVFLVLGTVGSVVIAIGGLLLAICHAPLPFRMRVALVVLGGVALAFARAGRDPVGIPAAAWPVLASMLMFRSGIYLGALRREDAPAGVASAVAYTFMLPNACFPLYPIIDYRTFLRSREQGPSFDTIDRGLSWIVRGILHLLVYRLIFSDVAPREMLVYGMGDLVRHLLSGVLLYLKVSGTFHVITGILYLFGFALSPTHRLYLLATGFADYWRRINTYVREFLLKTVYYAVFLRLRSRTTVVRVVAATVAVFAASWLLHAYQYFWINGRFLWRLQDWTFWAVFAVLVSGAAIRGLRRRARAPGAGWSARRGWSTLVTFATITVLWSWWSARSVDSWLYLWTTAWQTEVADWILLGLVVACVFTLGASAWSARRALEDRIEPWSLRRSGWRLALIGGLCAAVTPSVQGFLPGRVQQYAEHLRGYLVVEQHELARLRGYYEEVTRVRPGEDVTAAPPRFENDTPDLYLSRDDFLMNQLRPSVNGRQLGEPFQTNAAGLRDREYATTKPSGTFRIALIGPSDAMGAGVGNDAGFEALLEVRLDREARRAGRRVEIINFSFNAWSLAQRVLALRTIVAPYAPDLVVVSVNPYEVFLLQMALTEALKRHVTVPDSALASILGEARLAEGMDAGTMVAVLRPLEERLHRRALAWAADGAREMNARIAIVTLSFPGVSWMGGLSMLRRSAFAEGLPVIECAGIWRWSNGNALALSIFDPHPNAAGHRMIADCLFNALTGSPLLAGVVGGVGGERRLGSEPAR